MKHALEMLLSHTAFEFRELDGYVLIVDRASIASSRFTRPDLTTAETITATSTSTPTSDQRRGDSSTSPAPETVGIEGIVTGRDDEPLTGVRVHLANLGRTADTGPDGRFSIAGLPRGVYVLRASHPGYAEIRRTVDVRAAGASGVALPLLARALELEGLVAVGYGTARRRDLTGSIGSVTVTDATTSTQSSIGQLLQGRVAGVLATQNNGAPGSGVSIRVRGTSSISAATDPLYVIDGVPAFSSLRGNDAGANPLLAINPSDIESIEVLKDASSTAIYGARGAAGVVLVTTKRGRRGEDQLSLESTYGVQLPARRIDMLDGPQFAALIREARENAGLGPISPVTGEPLSQAELDVLDVSASGTNWQDLVLRNASTQSHTLGFSGGDDRTRYFISGSVFDQDGIIIGSDFVRYSGRINLERSQSDRLRVGTSLTVAQTAQNVQRTDNGLASGAVMSALWFNPLVGPRLNDGSWRITSPVTWPATNPLPGALEDINRLATFNVVGSGFAEADLRPGLRFRSSLGIAANLNRSEAYARASSPDGRAARGVAEVSSAQTINLTHENLLSHGRPVGDGHLELTSGFTVQTSRSERVEARNEQFANDLTGPWNLSAGTRPSADTDYGNWALLSFLGRATYNLGDTYLFTLTGRGDGSSRFGNHNKWGFFPSAAFAWRVFSRPSLTAPSILDDIKLRLSYGVTGNQEIGLYQSLERLVPVQSTVGGQPEVGYANAGSAPNPDLKWETTRQYNVGVDFGILGNRITGAFDAYRSVTDDLLLLVSLPRSSGFSTQLRNVGSVRNDGVELSLNTINVEGRVFRWNSSLTVAHNRNEVVGLGASRELPVANQKGINMQTGQDVLKMMVGQPLGTFVGKKTSGLYQAGDPCPLTVRRPTLDCVPGEYRYVDSDGNGVINSNDNVILGNGQPDFYGGLSNDFGLGRFDLSAFLQFSHGAEIMNAPAINMKQLNTFSNQTTDALNRWTPTNTNTTIPRANASRPREVYDLHIEDGSFIRLQTVTLGYNLPAGVLPATNGARVYFTGQNVHLWTKYSGFDPEVNSFGADATAPGVDAGAYPRALTWTAGINLTF